MSYLGPKVHIDLQQLKKNYQIVKSEVGEIPIMATVKANAYGHGAVEVSKALEEEGVRYLAVFTIDEGIELRDAGIKTDIFISDVEITSILIFFSAKALNIRYVTPGVVIIPTPTIDTFETFLSKFNFLKLILNFHQRLNWDHQSFHEILLRFQKLPLFQYVSLILVMQLMV